MSAALTPRRPFSIRLTLEELTCSRSATWSTVQPFSVLSDLSNTPSSRRRTIGLLPVVGTPVTPLYMGVQCNTSEPEEQRSPPVSRTGTCHVELALASSTWRSHH